ncbi:YceD family protein [Pelotomaculum propionicicum]|uniref:YceD family protein n=1 Tax=Pelotomaculum propionicicum TaxID=258475 RepID=UPI003B824F74
MMRLDVARLKRSPGDSARYDLAADLPPLDISGEIIAFVGPVKAVLAVSNTGEVIEVEGTADGKLELSCSRCLKRFIYDFQAPVDEKYSLAQDGGNEEIPSVTGDFIDIAPAVLNSIYLALPMKAVCVEGCQGLCPVCGRNLNEGRCGCAAEDIDPRMSVLKELLKKDDN